MVKTILRWVFLFLLATACLRATRALAEVPVMHLRELALDYQNFIDEGRDLLLYPETHKESLAVDMKIDLLGPLYWNNLIAATTTDAQYRTVGLTSELGAHVFSRLDVFYRHTSIHLLDRAHSYLPKFPVYDAVGVRITLYKE